MLYVGSWERAGKLYFFTRDSAAIVYMYGTVSCRSK
jgi:hypothetical protein